jgi:uncharacterized protein (DUF1501 family)
MKRRDFVKKLPLLSGMPFALNGVPVRLFARQTHLTRMANLSRNNRVLVVLQLHGGNDGLNSVIPVEQYDQYYSRRANIAIPANNSVRRMIPLDATLPGPIQVGLHPDMLDAKRLYDSGKMGIIQGVSYRNNNGSHFRGRDIWFMGGGADDYYSSGWVGRYLQSQIRPQVFPDDFPNEVMPDPLAIELGSDVSLIFHQPGNIPTSISLGSNPESFARLIAELEGYEDEGLDPRGRPPEFLNDSPYGKELNWILGLEDKSEVYAERLLEVYQRSPESNITYPERYPFNAPQGSARNSLSGQLQLIARLLDGGGIDQGVKTKVFLVRIGGFDTHANQVESYDPTMGVHGALLYHISSAMRAFQSDLRSRGIEERVLTVTTSEFGRRISSNGSYGTDHGTGAPLFLFGSGVKPGIIGQNPDLSLENRNIPMQFDYRQVFSSILLDWMQVDRSVIENDIFFGNYFDGPDQDGGNYEKITVAENEITGNADFIQQRFYLGNAYPNPARLTAVIPFHLNHADFVRLELLDETGIKVKTIADGTFNSGLNEIRADLSGLNPGLYFYQINSTYFNESKKLIVR